MEATVTEFFMGALLGAIFGIVLTVVSGLNVVIHIVREESKNGG